MKSYRIDHPWKDVQINLMTMPENLQNECAIVTDGNIVFIQSANRSSINFIENLAKEKKMPIVLVNGVHVDTKKHSNHFGKNWVNP